MTHTLTVDTPDERLDRFVAARIPALSRARVQDLITQGHVQVDGRPARASLKAPVGATVVVTVPEVVPSPLVPQAMELDILYEDPDVLVLNKPAGLVVHPARGHADGTLVNGLLAEVEDLGGVGGEERPGLVHRLDKGTSGVMVVAKHDAALAGLKEQFQVHSVERRYLALVLGTPDLDAGRVENELGRAPNDRFRFAAVPGGKPAVTTWQVRERLGPCTLLECRLHTGRTHQVRVHLSELGWPILGDPLYRARKTLPRPVAALLEGVDHQLLHATRLDFTHPGSGERLRFDQPPPEDFQRVLEGLRALRAPRASG